MFAAGRKAVDSSGGQQTEDDWLSVGKSFSSGKCDDKAKDHESSESALQVYKHWSGKHRHKENKKKEKKRESRHLSKHKKKSKEKKRKRSPSRSDSSDDTGGHRSGHRSRRRLQSRSNSRVREVENRIVAQAGNEIVVHEQAEADGEGTIFEVDCVGDRDNRFFGSTYVHDQPLYKLATRRNLLTGTWLSHKQPTYLPPNRPVEKKDSDRYFSVQARKAEKDGRQKRLYLAYSEKRLAHAATNNKLTHRQDNRGGSAALSSPSEMAFIPLDPVVNVRGLENGGMGEEVKHSIAGRDGDTGIMLTDGQSVEQYLVQRNKLLNAAVSSNPWDIDAWLDLMAFQEQTMRLHTKTKTTSAMKASVEEKQAAILARALSSNPESRELHRVKLNMSIQSEASGGGAGFDSCHRQLENLLAGDLTNGGLWIKLLQSRQQHFSGFSMQSVRNLYARILSVLRSAAHEAAESVKSPVSATDVNGKADTESRGPVMERLSLLLLDFHFLMCIFEKKAGFVEHSIAQVQALIDFSMNDFSGGSTGVHLDRLQNFAVRWNDESTKGFGDEGWNNFTFDYTLEDEPPQMSVPDFKEYIQASCVTKLDYINPPEVLRTKEHKQSLLDASAKFVRKFRINGGSKSELVGERNSGLSSSLVDFDASHESETETRTDGNIIYSNLHGYRISVDDADDAKEYERILGELRGTETARVRQDQLLEKEKVKRAMLAVTESEVEDQRANFDVVGQDDRFVKWLTHEEVQTALQWAPLSSNNPLHEELIERQPERATLTEEIQPFLFPVSTANQWRPIAQLLRVCGVKWCGPYEWESDLRFCQSMYADDVSDCELLVAPILTALDPQSFHSKKQGLFLKPHERKILLEGALLDDVAVEQGVLCDPTKVSFVRRVYMQALNVSSNSGNNLASTLKCLWIGFEAEVMRTLSGGKAADLGYARRLSQYLVQKTPSDDPDLNVLYAYAKLELKLGNERQVKRICENTLTSIGIPSSSDAAMARIFHRFVFLRARVEMWLSATAQKEHNAALTRDQERLRILRCLYTLWDVWQPVCQEKETLDTISKKQRKLTRARLEEQLVSDPSVGAKLIARYHAELDTAIQHCVESTSHDCKDRVARDSFHHRATCWVGYCLHNLALVVYAYRGFEAACHEYHRALVNIKHNTCSHLVWMWTGFLEFMQQHQTSGFFPAVAPRAWRSSVSQAVEKFPNNALFLRLFVDSETGNPISQVLRNYSRLVEKRWQRYYDSPELVEWLFALLCEICRAERAATIKDLSDTARSNSDDPSRPTCCLFHRWGMNATAVGRIRQMFESMVNHIRTKGNALCWRLYMHFEIALGKVDAAKKILYRGIAACGWSKSLYMDGLRMMRVYLSEDECQELLEFMEAKELNIRADFE